MSRLRSIALALLALALPATAAPAPQEQGPHSLALRISATGPDNRVVVDRGARDKIEVGDLVQFFPRDGGGGSPGWRRCWPFWRAS